jgi:hypothetical protein
MRGGRTTGLVGQCFELRKFAEPPSIPGAPAIAYTQRNAETPSIRTDGRFFAFYMPRPRPKEPEHAASRLIEF